MIRLTRLHNINLTFCTHYSLAELDELDDEEVRAMEALIEKLAKKG